ncbi:phage baseplate assembly protein domain-containing protein [Roseomonas chloroacetimidivorans]|uniref:phage baseplate assembly protein domain-containing protein n=1 Tax=Roseomonas chloroacetimidivorans TaxID=1766656 RepID=UPI003C7701CA
MSGARGWMERLGTTFGMGLIAATRVDRGRGRKTITAQVQLAETGETRDDLPLLGVYGFFARPRAGADAAVVFLGGNRGAGVVIATGDGRYGPDLAEGEFGWAHPDGASIIFRNGGVIELTAPGGFTQTGGPLTHNGVNVGATHKHSGVQQGGSQTGEPLP